MTGRAPGPGQVGVSRQDKVFFPGEGITKGDLIRYYRSMAGTLLPHLRDRPLTLQRFPDGITQDGFYQKETPDYFPGWIQRASISLEEGGTQEQVVLSSASDLVYLANQGVVTLHAWLSRRHDLRTPDRMIFDLDPPGDEFDPVRRAAQALRDLLEELGLVPFLMLTGSKGAHVRVPLRKGPDFDEVRSFARDIADHLAAAEPDSLTTEVRKKKREGRLFLDVARNAYGQTAVAPYSVRPKAGAPVATPLDWEELAEGDLTSRSYTLHSLPRRLGQKVDPWKGMGRHGRGIEPARKRLDRLQ